MTQRRWRSDGGLGPRFRLLWRAAAVSNVGDGVRVAALPLLAATITRDPVPVAIVTAALWLPWLVLGLHAGAVVDRVDRPVLIRNVQASRLLVEGSLAALVLTGHASMPAIYVAAFAIGAGEVLVDNALQSLVPRVAGRDDLERANSRLIAAETVGNELVGPPVGAALFAALPALPFGIDAASYGYSAWTAHRLSLRLPTEDAPVGVRRRIWHDMVDGLRWLRGHSYLRAITIWGGVFNVGSTAAISLLVLFALEVLDTGQAGYGVLLAVVAAGGLTGTAAASGLARRIGRGSTILVGAVGSGAAVAAVGAVDHAGVAAMLLFASGGLGAMVNVVGRALRQAMVPGSLLGRVTGANRVVVYGAMPIGATLGGWIARTASLPAAFAVGGLIMTAVSIGVAPWLREHLINDALTGTYDDASDTSER